MSRNGKSGHFCCIPNLWKIAIFTIRHEFDIDILSFFSFFFLFCLFQAASVAYGGSQAKGLIGAVAAGLHQSHSNARSEPHLQLTPQLMAMLDP